MPVVLAYVFVEVAAFMAVGFWIGFGWAILVVLGLMVVGSLLASLALRRTLAAAQSQQATPGAVAGDTGLIFAGWAMSLVPGIVSSLCGLILVFGPTRRLIRRSVARKLTRSMEDFGVRVFEHSPMAQQHTSYGTFGDGAPRTDQRASGDMGDDIGDDMVIDEEEISEWSKNVDPEDFREGK